MLVSIPVYILLTIGANVGVITALIFLQELIDKLKPPVELTFMEYYPKDNDLYWGKTIIGREQND